MSRLSLGPIYPRVTMIIYMYLHLCGSISQSHRGNIIFQRHNDNLYIQYLHLCGVHFAITYALAVSDRFQLFPAPIPPSYLSKYKFYFDYLSHYL